MSFSNSAGPKPRRIVVGVGAGIAAYKVPGVVRHFVKKRDDVRVMPTPASLHFVGRTTWEALTENPAHSGVFDLGAGVDHVEAARGADLIVIAPATADLIARIRAGRADDLLTTTILAATCPVLIVPAMHTAMWENPATQNNIAQLREWGYHILEPADGALSSGDSGPGRLPEPNQICVAAEKILEGAARHSVTAHSSHFADEHGVDQDLLGIKAFVTAGGTQEPLDPVRFLGNRSSGRQGVAIAQALLERGADVTLFAANIEQSLLPQGVEVVSTPSAQQLFDAVTSRAPEFQVGFFVAAVADFRPREVAEAKVKKTEANEDGWTIELVRNPDILKETASKFPHLYCVGFAAETGDLETVMKFGQEKARRKGANLIAINQVGGGRGFGTRDNAVTVVDAEGQTVLSASGSKLDVARDLVGLVATRIK